MDMALGKGSRRCEVSGARWASLGWQQERTRGQGWTLGSEPMVVNLKIEWGAGLGGQVDRYVLGTPMEGSLEKGRRMSWVAWDLVALTLSPAQAPVTPSQQPKSSVEFPS